MLQFNALSAATLPSHRPCSPHTAVAQPRRVSSSACVQTSPVDLVALNQLRGQAIVESYNRDVAPRLRTPESFLNVWALLLAERMPPCVGTALTVAPGTHDFARSYVVQDRIVESDVVGQLLVPEEPYVGPSIMLFRGSDFGAAPVGGSGLRADVDIAGVGHRAFASAAVRVRQALLGLSHEQRRRGVVFAGHSLGGVLGWRAAADYLENGHNAAIDAPPRVYTYCAPGVEKNFAEQLSTYQHAGALECKAYWVKGDPTPTCDHYPAIYALCAEPDPWRGYGAAHTLAFVALHESGQQIRVTEQLPRSSTWFTRLRRVAGVCVKVGTRFSGNLKN
jgi:hypothetical protein